MRSFMKLTALAAAALLVTTGCNVIRGEQTTTEYADDAALTARVKAALLDDEQVAGTKFDVNVFEGKVTLSGVANSEKEKERAEQIARQVPGVKDVESTIRLSEAQTSDSQ